MDEFREQKARHKQVVEKVESSDDHSESIKVKNNRYFSWKITTIFRVGTSHSRRISSIRYGNEDAEYYSIYL